MKLRKSLLLVLGALIFFLAGCESGGNDSSDTADSGEPTEDSSVEIVNEGDAIRLGTMNDEEGRILGSMMQLLLESNGYEVEPSVGQLVNNTTLMRSSIEQDQLDLSLDYTGRGLMFIEDVDSELYTQDEKTAFETSKEADEENGIIWLTYAPANNTDSLTVTQEFSEENGVSSLEDLATYINDGGELTLAIQSGYEYYTTAPTTLPGWEEAYGFEIPEENIIQGIADAKTALAGGTDGINIAGTNSTSGLVEALDLVILEDPKHVAPIYSPAPIASEGILEEYPELETMFNAMFESLDEATLVELNAQLEKEGTSEMDIAQNYLEENNYFN